MMQLKSAFFNKQTLINLHIYQVWEISETRGRNYRVDARKHSVVSGFTEGLIAQSK